MGVTIIFNVKMRYSGRAKLLTLYANLPGYRNISKNSHSGKDKFTTKPRRSRRKPIRINGYVAVSGVGVGSTG